jgi:D-amino peptidase
VRVLLITDMEGVAGITNSRDWCKPDGHRYEQGRRLLTLEVNAAIEGFFRGGASYVQVADAHGYGGIDVELLDRRVEYARGWAPEAQYSYSASADFTGIAWVGQHAKASTELAHLAHTQNMSYLDQSVNGISIGEFGQTALCAAELGVPAFFGSGDLAFCREAEALTPGIVTCPVKRGMMPGSGKECTPEEYERRNEAAIHRSPAEAREAIREAAEEAAGRLRTGAPPPVRLPAPYERVTVFRPESRGKPGTISRESHPASFDALMRLPFAPLPLSGPS